jgi:hypothetical protein
MVTEMKEKYSDILQVNSVVGEKNNKSVESRSRIRPYTRPAVYPFQDFSSRLLHRTEDGRAVHGAPSGFYHTKLSSPQPTRISIQLRIIPGTLYIFPLEHWASSPMDSSLEYGPKSNARTVTL